MLNKRKEKKLQKELDNSQIDVDDQNKVLYELKKEVAEIKNKKEKRGIIKWGKHHYFDRHFTFKFKDGITENFTGINKQSFSKIFSFMGFINLFKTYKNANCDYTFEEKVRYQGLSEATLSKQLKVYAFTSFLTFCFLFFIVCYTILQYEALKASFLPLPIVLFGYVFAFYFTFLIHSILCWGFYKIKNRSLKLNHYYFMKKAFKSPDLLVPFIFDDIDEEVSEVKDKNRLVKSKKKPLVRKTK